MYYGYQRQTRYAALSQPQLHSLFATENWQGLSSDARLDACQEVENRYAAEKGVRPCVIGKEPMDGGCYGYQSGYAIQLNSYLLDQGKFHSVYTYPDGTEAEFWTDVEAPGWNVLDTVYHEGTHGVQYYQSRMPDTYIDPNEDRELYRLQSIEKEAYAVGQYRALDALAQYEQETGHRDPQRQQYLAAVRNDSYEQALKEAAERYQDPWIDQTLHSFIEDRDNNRNRDFPSESYQTIRDNHEQFLLDQKNSYDKAQSASSVDGSDTFRQPEQGRSQGYDGSDSFYAGSSRTSDYEGGAVFRDQSNSY